MNAESYLRKQGWKGSGHSLDSTGRGIKKPLLIAHKQDQLGLGKKKAAWTTDDQWWMRAYDQSLQSIGTGEESTLSQIRTKGINHGGLYGFFVKGEAIAGTIDDTSSSATDTSIPPSGASTPLTSASDTEAPIKVTKKMSDKKTKRKRAEEVTPAVGKEAKKAKSDKESKTAQKQPTTSSEAARLASLSKQNAEDRDAVARKVTKLLPQKRALYKERAAIKKQTLHEYILRRVQKKSEKRSTSHSIKPTRPVLGLDEHMLAAAISIESPIAKPVASTTTIRKTANEAEQRLDGNAKSLPTKQAMVRETEAQQRMEEGEEEAREHEQSQKQLRPQRTQEGGRTTNRKKIPAVD